MVDGGVALAACVFAVHCASDDVDTGCIVACGCLGGI